MSDKNTSLPTTARVVVIGGGSVGCSVLYHLAERGWQDCLLLESDELTSGSTWHAAGNCPNYVASWTMMKIQSYSNTLYRQLGDLVDYPMNYHVTGAIRLAHSRQRMEEFQHVKAMGRQMGLEFEMLSPSEIKDYYPFIETHDLEGGQWDALDGDIDPAQLTQALARGARQKGAKIERFCPVTAIERVGSNGNGEWKVTTPKGSVRCQYIVNAAGYRAAEVGRLLAPAYQREVPLATMAHQYLVTESIEALKNRDTKLPLLRDPDSSYYLRQEKDGLLLGPYEKNCRAHWTGGDDPMPENFAFQLFNDDLERLEWYIDDACARVPILGDGGISRVVNGPIPYTPDGLPLIGPTPGVPDSFEACVFTFGIVQAGGAGKLLADWMIDGEPDSDAWAVDPRRFTAHVDQVYTLAKAVETYSHEYAMHFPTIQWPAGRFPESSSPNVKQPMLYSRLKEAGAVFGAYGGWERADWFNPQKDPVAMVTSYDRQPWFEQIGAECRHVAEQAGFIDLSGFSRFAVKGPGAKDYLEHMITGRLPGPGRSRLVYLASPQGRVLSEMTATCFAPDHYWLICGAGAHWHDRDWLTGHLPENGKVTLTDCSLDYGTLLVTGPKAPALLEKVSGSDLSQTRFLDCFPLTIAGVEVTAIRLSFVGEAGLELHIPTPHMATVYDHLQTVGGEFGLKPFGMLALDSMRLEKNYRSWKGDLSSDYTMLESGLSRFIDFNKSDFIGRAAMLAEKQRGVAQRFITLKVEDPADGQAFGEVVYLSPITINGVESGLVLSGGYGHRVGHSIALGIVQEKALNGSTPQISISVLGRERKASLMAGPAFYDPDNIRLRG